MTSVQTTSLSEVLKQHRSNVTLSQAELAERSGLSVRAISNLERGVNRTPRNDTIRMLVAALELAGHERKAFGAVAYSSDAPPGDGPAP